MLNKLIPVLVSGLLAGALFSEAQGETLQLDRKSSSVTFSGELGSIHAGGRFTDVSASMLFGRDVSVPSGITYSADLKTVKFTEGGPQEQMLLASLASSLPPSVAVYSSSSIEKVAEGSIRTKGDVQLFGRTYVMTIPFTLHKLAGGKVRATGTLKDRGKVLPLQVPGVSGEFNGVLKFDLIFTPRTE